MKDFICTRLMDCRRTGVSISLTLIANAEKRNSLCVYTIAAEEELARDLNLGLWVCGVMHLPLNRSAPIGACEMSHLNVASAVRHSVCQLKRGEQLNNTC